MIMTSTTPRNARHEAVLRRWFLLDRPLQSGDQWHARVLAFAATLDAYHLYTTDEVLTELLAF